MLHLSYDGNQENGIIYNDTYPTGVLYTGVENKPVLTFPFDSFQYSEIFPGDNVVIINNEQFIMTSEQETEVAALAASWVQPLGQEGNPTLEQSKIAKKNDMSIEFDKAVVAISSASSHEMDSWRKQEEQARAWQADVDGGGDGSSVSTPMIDALVVSRDLGETKDVLVGKIITKADAYETAYAVELGKFHNREHLITTAVDAAAVELIVW